MGSLISEISGVFLCILINIQGIPSHNIFRSKISHTLYTPPPSSTPNTYFLSPLLLQWFPHHLPEALLSLCFHLFFFFFRFYVFIHGWHRKRQRHRQREKQAPSGTQGLHPRTLGSGPEPKADAQPLSHPDAPVFIYSSHENYFHAPKSKVE